MPGFPTATLDDLLVQARATNRLLVAMLKDQLSQTQLVELLMEGGGMTVRDVAGILGTTMPTVAVTVQRLRKKGKLTTRGIRLRSSPDGET